MNNEVNGKHLSPLKHPQQDFFIADIFDAISLQLDMASMEYPLFALKAGIRKGREFQQGNFSIKISPSVDYGLATIHDKDIWIYCISKLMQGLRDGTEINRTVHFTIYDYLKTTNRGVGGREYELAKDSLDRLRSTTITTNIETADRREARGFGLIDAWKIVEEKDGRMIRVSVTLPEWLYRSIESKSVLTISPDYFRLRKPLDRRIYELARKHCGQNHQWTFNLDTLQKRTGSTSNLRLFRQAIRSLAKSNQLPDYSVQYNQEKDQVTFLNRSVKDKEYISESEFVQLGYGKDSYQTVVEALSQGRNVSKNIQQKYNVTDKKFIQALKTAENSNVSRSKNIMNFILNQSMIDKIRVTILKSIRDDSFMSEEVKISMIKIEINEHYDQISNNYKIIDENNQLLSEMDFKRILYAVFNISNS
ncbi:replication initiator protein A [Wohlfahrtiimonas chitiniclastica]|uniref:replication initiator protein A n=1 Tax=Wohlfahrtiimonas chitiniclastica TaxID=400946 RepID=UPI001BD1044C|nr:replication initiator protein A [Wohlfahrtiimonas chitiniclastica]MBS7829372.1 replication initiator protein A [Wohlfahrtiimonas chitiniclastica]